MVLLSVVIACALFFSDLVATASVKNAAPVFSSTYQVSGVLRLPYAEIVEPFLVMYDGPNKRSRIDYYNGLTKTIQRADVGAYGISYKLAYMTTYTVTNVLSCFQVNGSQDNPVGIQTIFPDTTSFTFLGKDIVNEQVVSKWGEVVVNGNKTNTYTLWVNSDTNAPVRYEMMGYDSLLGSHYDKYYLDYSDYLPDVVFSSDIFTAGNLTCTGFPGPGAEHHVTINPMREFVHHFDDHTHTLFSLFKDTHNKAYDSEKDHENRKHVFRQNLRYISSVNRAGRTYQMAINHLADKTDTELKMMRGFHRTKNYKGGLPFNKTEFANVKIPDQWDWRLLGSWN